MVSLYEEGEQVKVTYYPLGTDTIYSFHANADDVVTHLKGDVATITFTMPAHDVEVTCTSKSAMSVCGPDNSLFMGLGMLFPRMVLPMPPLKAAPQEPASEEPVIDTEWICPVCQTKKQREILRLLWNARTEMISGNAMLPLLYA